MLNELHSLVAALEGSGTSYGSPHPALAFMGKADALHVLLDAQGKPSGIRIIPGDRASKLMRVAHSSSGAAFPGFNLPIPLRQLPETLSGDALDAVVNICASLKAKVSTAAEIIAACQQLWDRTSARGYEEAQVRQFARSTGELTKWLATDLTECPESLGNFSQLVEIVGTSQPSLADFAAEVASCLWQVADPQRDHALLLCQVAFGLLHFPSVKEAVGSATWWAAKRKADAKETEKNVPLFLDLAASEKGHVIATPGFWAELNTYLNHLKPVAYKADARATAPPARKKAPKKQSAAEIAFTDAFSGEACTIPDSYPKPKVAKLGEVRLFSNNTKEAKCFIRYGLEGSETFAMSEELAQQMAGALAHVGAEDKLGITCRAIPSGKAGKQDLLIAYLDAEPDTDTAFADMMGGTLEDEPGSNSGFEPRAAAVLELLYSKMAANPELRMQLFAIAVVDKANRQISLCRNFLVADLVMAVKRWGMGHRPVAHSVSLFAYDRVKKANTLWYPPSVFPLDLVALANKVWSSNDKAGLTSSFNRVLNSGDAFDVFLQDSQRALRTREIALSTLIQRTRSLFTKGGEYKAKRDFSVLGEVPRRELLKAVSLLSILIHLHPSTVPMKEPTYYLGRLLACADALHLEYCKHVRGGETPTQLIGNALFNTALEQPVFALARLAERLTPYKAWATTYKHVPKGENDKGGLEKWLLGRIAECCAQFIETDADSVKRIRAEELPSKMTDLDKAKLMLGYMADLREAKA